MIALHQSASVVAMESVFDPAPAVPPRVHAGSQSDPLLPGKPQEQEWEAAHAATAGPDDVIVGRGLDPAYLAYRHALMGEARVVDVADADPGADLSSVLLARPAEIARIRAAMHPDARLDVFLPTAAEAALATALGIPLHGTPSVSDRYGGKAGIRRLAQQLDLPMAPGFICATPAEVSAAARALGPRFREIVVKHDRSLGGTGSARVSAADPADAVARLDEIAGGRFVEGRDVVVVEGWLRGRAALCVQLELLPGQEPRVVAGWRQVMAPDGIAYAGAGPLDLSERALASLLDQARRLAWALSDRGAVGSFGPDFLVVDPSETEAEPDACVLLELNARVPMTAIPLEIARRVRGRMGDGFLARQINVPAGTRFADVAERLADTGLLITAPSPDACGAVPYNVGLLPWGRVSLALLAPSWEQTQALRAEIDRRFPA